jgi:beta-lactamase superfamily II metal-dependent hydrolase
MHRLPHFDLAGTRRLRDLAAALLAAAVLSTTAPAQEPHVQVTFLDVGQGDAIVVVSPEGRTAMIDGGSDAPLRYLQQMSVDSIDLLVATHPHRDHIGGLDDVLTARPVRFFMDNGVPHSTATYARLMATLDRLEEVTYLRATPRTITLGSVTLEVLPIPAADAQLNDRSVGLVLRFGDFTAFLSGDSEVHQLNEWTSRGDVPDVVLLKAPHHGSVNGFTRDFLAAARPDVVVVSVGADNAYGHPRPEALTAYAAVGARVLRTDRSGHVTVLGHADGGFEIVTGPGARALGPEPATVGATNATGVWAERLSLRVVADTPGDDHVHLNGEYAVLVNRSVEDVPIGGWRLCDLRSRCFRFPPGARIVGGGQVRVYTGYGTSDGLSFFMNNDRAVWNNDGDEATLFDEWGVMVLRYVY